jgi:hypothetical protein
VTATGPENERHVLVVTGLQRDRLYDRFTRLYAFSSDVLVMRDKRYIERRSSAARPEPDRRRGDRRMVRPDWVFPPETG